MAFPDFHRIGYADEMLPLGGMAMFHHPARFSRVSGAQESGSLGFGEQKIAHFRTHRGVRLRARARRVRTAFLAALWRAVAPLLRATLRACDRRDTVDAARLPSFLSAALVARDRFSDGFRRDLPPLRFWLTVAWPRLEAMPFLGLRNLTPARRALESPMAIACFVERAPCLPSRM